MSDDIKTIAEVYSSAISASNLRVVAEKPGKADVLIAVGWSASKLGAALLRLRSEYDSASRERILRSLRGVVEQVDIQAARWGIRQHVTPAVVMHWLSQVCHACRGRKFETVPDSPTLSAKRCGRCRGEGTEHVPHGDHGKRLLDYLDHCAASDGDRVKSRLYGFQ